MAFSPDFQLLPRSVVAASEVVKRNANMTIRPALRAVAARETTSQHLVRRIFLTPGARALFGDVPL
jgi:hypothetical protein